MPTLIVLTGLPGSGKSTLVSKLKKQYPQSFVYSTDQLIEEWSARMGWSYNMGFEKYIDKATKEMNELVIEALKNKNDIIWDQTNLNSKKRKSIISRFGNDYKKICICISPPKNNEETVELNNRLNSRVGKTIPTHVIENMMLKNYVEPSLDEGFDEVTILSLFDINKD
jgi:tRNA uridine 5-carbamoylmethylation protein Kti12